MDLHFEGAENDCHLGTSTATRLKMGAHLVVVCLSPCVRRIRLPGPRSSPEATSLTNLQTDELPATTIVVTKEELAVGQRRQRSCCVVAYLS